MKKFFFWVIILLVFSSQEYVKAQSNIIDEVVWVVGDDAILLSDVEAMREEMINEDVHLPGDPYCVIPEQLALQKLYLHQAKLDSIDISDSQVYQEVDARINWYVSRIGTQEKFEEYLLANSQLSVNEFRENLRTQVKENNIVREMKRSLVSKVKVTPSEVRTFFNRIPQDSLPYIPTTVEVEIITVEPQPSLAETDEIKRKLREYTELVTSGKNDFASLARRYSEDKSSAYKGGDLGLMGKSNLVPEFAAAAYDLNDPKRVSRIVETEYGFHIIQLIEKRGDRINVRHILLKAYVSPEELQAAVVQLDSLRSAIVADKITFEQAANYSYDRDTRYNKGLMVNRNETGDMSGETERTGTSRFEMNELPAEIAKVVSTLKVNEVSKSFTMVNSKQKEIAIIVKLKSRIEGHKANLADDFQAVQAMVVSERQNQILNKWLDKKIKETYIRINDNLKNCDFEKDGWVQK
ncbi:peptidylprolyl isomerase [Bacteroidia bacterium]|nr:peptidylprolyl isomerase [Bacteroidia bacterium]GHT26518.1 peptidylprolyl isomerase [Bacteroidia bacterium]